MPENDPGNKPRNKTGNKSGNEPGGIGNKTGNDPGNKPGNKTGNKPGGIGSKTGNEPGNEPGNKTGNEATILVPLHYIWSSKHTLSLSIFCRMSVHPVASSVGTVASCRRDDFSAASKSNALSRSERTSGTCEHRIQKDIL